MGKRTAVAEDFRAWADERLIEVAALRLGRIAARGESLWDALPQVIQNAPLLAEMEARWDAIKDRVQEAAVAGHYNRYHSVIG